jgi:hypothetical protein
MELLEFDTQVFNAASPLQPIGTQHFEILFFGVLPVFDMEFFLNQIAAHETVRTADTAV